jgi:hypothetical protein
LSSNRVGQYASVLQAKVLVDESEIRPITLIWANLSQAFR